MQPILCHGFDFAPGENVCSEKVWRGIGAWAHLAKAAIEDSEFFERPREHPELVGDSSDCFADCAVRAEIGMNCLVRAGAFVEKIKMV